MFMKTWHDIEVAALTDPFLQRLVTLVARGDLTREQALIETVLALSTVRQQQHNQLVELLRNSPIPTDRLQTFLTPDLIK